MSGQEWPTFSNAHEVICKGGLATSYRMGPPLGKICSLQQLHLWDTAFEEHFALWFGFSPLAVV